MWRANVTNPNGRKQSRTKFTQYQKERMLEFAERVGWKLQKRDEELISDFCSKIGVKKRVLKAWMHNNENTFGMERVTSDILPECLIHKIVSYLSFKEAAKVSILSKTWLQAWLTHPNLEFKISYFKDNIKIVDSIMERYRDGKIPIEKFKLLSSDSHDVPLLIDKWLDIALQNGVKDLVFGIHSFTSLRELLLKRRGLILRGSLSSGVTNCISLRKLSLSYAWLDDNMLQTLLNSCPLIDTFILEYCPMLKKIELLNLQKIKSISIRTFRNQFVKIQAPTLERLFCCGALEESPMLDVANCQNLKSLELSCMNISDGFFQHLFSRSQSLESLILDSVDKGLERFKICGSQSLRILKITDCNGIAGEIDASNLVSLEYSVYQIPMLKIEKESSQLKHSHISIDSYPGDNLNASWFCKLNKFLLNSISWSQVSLQFYECNEINMKDLQLHQRVATPQVDVDVLKVNFLWLIDLCPTFVDALLWSCRPKRFNLRLSTLEEPAIEMICFMDRLLNMKNSSHSTSRGSNSWHSQLKEVKAYTILKNQPRELKSGELALRSLRQKGEICFSLDWGCS